MKKNFKSLVALVLAIMVFASMSVAFAANGASATHTITITNDDQVGAHTYEAYQVFAGDYDASSKKLSNITWGAGVDGTAILNAVKADTTTFGADAANAATPEDVAKLLGGAGTDTEKAKKFAAIVGANLSTTVAGTSEATASPYAISVTGDGYYFVKDKAGTLPTDTDNQYPQKADAETRYILQVVNDVTVAAKSNTVQSSKKIDDTNDSTGTAEATQDSADYDIGDKIPYTLTATLPSNYADFEAYYLQFVDDMSEGLTYNNDAKIYYGTSDTTGANITFTEDTSATSDYTNGTVYTATIKNLKTEKAGLTAGTVITIKYSATLNDKAVIGETGNPNKSHIVFNNNPNNSGEGKPTSTTPDDKVIAFTYELEVDKVTGTPAEKLTGANFALYKLFKDEEEMTKVNEGRAAGSKYTKATEIKYDNKTKEYAIGTDIWALVSEITATDKSEFTFSGIDDGTYLLVETKTPDGYNSIQPMKFTVEADHDKTSDDPKLNSITGSDAKGSATTLDAISLSELMKESKKTGLKTDVVNNGGATLPSTGGIGTTIFYVAGSILVLAAAILLITKRRMGAND